MRTLPNNIYPDTSTGRMAWVNAVLALATQVEMDIHDNDSSDPDLAQAVARVYYHAFDREPALLAAVALARELENYVEADEMPLLDTDDGITGKTP